jgi:hypothetical protein
MSGRQQRSPDQCPVWRIEVTMAMHVDRGADEPGESRPHSRAARRDGSVARRWSVEQIRQLGVTTDIVTASSVLGIGRTTAYKLARDGHFPVPVLQVGTRYVVAVAHLLAALGAKP